MELVVAFVSFAAVVAAWFVLPASPPETTELTSLEGVRSAA